MTQHFPARSLLTPLILALGLLTGGANAAEPKIGPDQTLLDRIVAVVNNSVITQTELEEEPVEAYEPSYFDESSPTAVAT